MLRIVGLQRSEIASEEFVLLQNQGSLRIKLRGFTLLSESALASGALNGPVHVFTEDVPIPAGCFVHLCTGSGTPHWTRSRDGARVFRVYMGRRSAVWTRHQGPLHLLWPQHTYAERAEALLMR